MITGSANLKKKKFIQFFKCSLSPHYKDFRLLLWWI